MDPGVCRCGDCPYRPQLEKIEGFLADVFSVALYFYFLFFVGCLVFSHSFFRTLVVRSCKTTFNQQSLFSLSLSLSLSFSFALSPDPISFFLSKIILFEDCGNYYKIFGLFVCGFFPFFQEKRRNGAVGLEKNRGGRTRNGVKVEEGEKGGRGNSKQKLWTIFFFSFFLFQFNLILSAFSFSFFPPYLSKQLNVIPFAIWFPLSFIIFSICELFLWESGG